jgi:hypothetical protein
MWNCSLTQQISFVEQVDDPAMYLSLYGVLWSLGIQNVIVYIDDVLSINKSGFAEFLPLIYPPELEVKETTDTASPASFLNLYLQFDDSGQIST